jgi:hypothetical protein
MLQFHVKNGDLPASDLLLCVCLQVPCPGLPAVSGEHITGLLMYGKPFIWAAAVCVLVQVAQTFWREVQAAYQPKPGHLQVITPDW